MQAILQRFLSFDRPIGPALVRVVYFVGAALIVMVVGFAIIMALMALFAGNVGTGVMQLIAAPAVGAVGFVWWRFLCELFLLAFMAYERLVEIRDRLPDYSQF
jgi:hypothetical protein